MAENDWTGQTKGYKTMAKRKNQTSAAPQTSPATEAGQTDQIGMEGAAAAGAGAAQADAGLLANQALTGQTTETTETTETMADAPPPNVFLRVLETGTTDPRALEINEDRNVRRFKHTAKSIEERALDMLANGQLAPITVTRSTDNGSRGKLTVEWGYLRALAGVYIREHELDPNWEIRYEVVDATDWLTHLCRGAAENIKRKEMGDIDMLHLFKRLKAEGLDQRRIALRLAINEGVVSRIFGLEKLDAREQRMVAQGLIPSEHARELATIPKDVRKPLVEKIAGGEKVTVSEIKQTAAQARRDAKAQANGTAAEGEETEAESKGGKTEDAEPQGRALSAKQVGFPFALVAQHPTETETEPDAVEKWAAKFGDYRMGNYSARKLVRELYKLAAMEPPSWLRSIPE